MHSLLGTRWGSCRGCITFPRPVTLHAGFLTLCVHGKYTSKFRKVPRKGLLAQAFGKSGSALSLHSLGNKIRVT